MDILLGLLIIVFLLVVIWIAIDREDAILSIVLIVITVGICVVVQILQERQTYQNALKYNPYKMEVLYVMDKDSNLVVLERIFMLKK